jgi:hypothetical protein
VKKYSLETTNIESENKVVKSSLVYRMGLTIYGDIVFAGKSGIPVRKARTVITLSSWDILESNENTIVVIAPRLNYVNTYDTYLHMNESTFESTYIYD